jgi:RNase P protein component
MTNAAGIIRGQAEEIVNLQDRIRRQVRGFAIERNRLQKIIREQAEEIDILLEEEREWKMYIIPHLK